MAPKVLVVVSAGSVIPVGVAGDAADQSEVNSGNFNQVTAVKRVRQLRPSVLRCGFDEAGTTLASADDSGIFVGIRNCTIDYHALQGFDRAQKQREVEAELVRTTWWRKYTGGVHSFLKAVAQEPGVSQIVAVCLPGGPITDVEHRAMPTILQEFEADALRTLLRTVPVEAVYPKSWRSFMDLVEEASARERAELSATPIQMHGTLGRPGMSPDEQVGWFIQNIDKMMEFVNRNPYNTMELLQRNPRATVALILKNPVHTCQYLQKHPEDIQQLQTDVPQDTQQIFGTLSENEQCQLLIGTNPMKSMQHLAKHPIDFKDDVLMLNPVDTMELLCSNLDDLKELIRNNPYDAAQVLAM